MRRPFAPRRRPRRPAGLVDAVTTLPPGDPATVEVSFSSGNVHFSFGLPAGVQGEPGATGGIGPAGPPGDQGPPGEVSALQLSSAIAGTSSNTNGVAILGAFPASDPPTLADLQLVAAKVDELIAALRRV